MAATGKRARKARRKPTAKARKSTSKVRKSTSAPRRPSSLVRASDPRLSYERQNKSGLFTEISFTDPLGSLVGSLFPYNPNDLVGKKGLEIFDKVRRDDQVHAALRIKKLGVLAPGWQVKAPEGEQDTPDMERRIKFVQHCLSMVGDDSTNIGSTFEYDLEEIMTALDYGFSITELVYRMIVDGPFAGLIGLKALKTRKPHSFDFKTDPHGNLTKDGIRQTVAGGYLELPPSKFVLYTYSPEFDNPYGQSDLVNIYREWFAKDTASKFRLIVLERYGEPLADVEYDQTIGSEDQDSIESIMKNLSSRNYFIHPSGAKLNLREPQLRGVNAYHEAIVEWNLGIARGILIPKHLGITEGGEVGTLAQAKENMKIFAMVLQALRQDIARRVVQRQIIRPLMRLNFNPPEPMPIFEFNPLTTEEALELAGSFLDAAEKRIVIPSREDESHMRRLTQFPERLEEGSVLPEDAEDAGDPGDKGNDEPDGPDAPEDTPGKGKEYDADLLAAFARAGRICACGSAHEYRAEKFDLLRAPETPAEKRFAFKDAADDLNEISEAAGEEMVAELTALKDKAKVIVGRLWRPFPAPGDARKFAFPAAGFSRLRKIVERFTEDGFGRGRALARKAIRKSRSMANPILLTPEKALAVFRERAFWVTGIISDDLTNGMRGVIYNAILTGATLQETEVQIARLFDQYAMTPELSGSVTEEARKAARVENVIRTNLMTAYNQGALVEYTDAGKDGMVEAVQFSAILDARTTEVCRHLDKKILPIGHPSLMSITPPLHYQCRSMLIPILVGDEWRASSTRDINRGKELADPGFIAA